MTRNGQVVWWFKWVQMLWNIFQSSSTILLSWSELVVETNYNEHGVVWVMWNAPWACVHTFPYFNRFFSWFLPLGDAHSFEVPQPSHQYTSSEGRPSYPTILPFLTAREIIWEAASLTINADSINISLELQKNTIYFQNLNSPMKAKATSAM